MSNNIKDLDNILKPLVLVKIIRAFYTTIAEYILFASMHRVFTNTENILGQTFFQYI